MAVVASRIIVKTGAACPNWFPGFFFESEPVSSLTVALAKTRQAPARPPPQQDHPMPRVQATCLSSCALVQTSSQDVIHIMSIVQPRITCRTAEQITRTELSKLVFQFQTRRLPVGAVAELLLTRRARLLSGSADVGVESRSPRETRTASKRPVTTSNVIKAPAIQKKKPSQPGLRHR